MLAGLALLLAAGCTNPQDSAPLITAPGRGVKLPAGALTEASGLAPSLLRPDALWLNNDSGDTPTLYQLSMDGRELGRIRIEGATATDWEDCASFTYKGQPWLLAADTGDNDQQRDIITLWIAPEPEPSKLSPGKPLKVGLAWSIRVRFPEGPEDCESVGVDATEERIYLISKRSHPPVVYSVPLKPAGDGVVVAQRVTALEWMKPASGLGSTLPTPRGRYANQPTGLSFSQDGRMAVILTYVDTWLYTRAPGQSWAELFSKPGVLLPDHGLLQAEAVCLSADSRSIFITSEGAEPPLLRYRLTPRP
jgi:hypothetical protein